ADARARRARVLARPPVKRARLLAGKGRERPERGDEAADGRRVAAPPPHLHRRPLRTELRGHPGVALALGLRIRLGRDRAHDPGAARVVQEEELVLTLMATLIPRCRTSSARTASSVRSTSTARKGCTTRPSRATTAASASSSSCSTTTTQRPPPGWSS